ncbi:dihydrofolate reductase family protein [Natrarchaeobius sp. A-rgal3]|uniref:dihydrofolate reductase family protein n=1 Tax=Natrarchaeobius versutus TaxID=1679078 RepID=UPI00350EA40C
MDGEIVLYIAVSVDGYIASEDGGVEWLEEFESAPENEHGGYEAFFESVDALVMGATTYEQVRSFGEWPYEDRPTYVLTRRDHPPGPEGVQFVDDEVTALAARETAKHDRIWLVGGATVARAFLRAGLVDELRLSIVPRLLGSGISLFGDDGAAMRLKLIESTTAENGILELRYAVGG